MQVRRKTAVAGDTGRVGRHIVDVLKAGGHDFVEMSRSSGVDVVTADSQRPWQAWSATVLPSSMRGIA
jgi:nucleoside-diphosphate-sugar epimerase